MTDQLTQTTGSDIEYDGIEHRSGEDRRKAPDRRTSIRYEDCRRKNHGRRKEDKDPWKDSLSYET